MPVWILVLILISGVALFTGPTPENLSNGTLCETTNQPTNLFLLVKNLRKAKGTHNLQNLSKEKINKYK
jgi:hypothetical protein